MPPIPTVSCAPGMAAAGDVLQGQVGLAVVLADLVDLHDVRVPQPGDRQGLLVGQGSPLAEKSLDRRPVAALPALDLFGPQ